MCGMPPAAQQRTRALLSSASGNARGDGRIENLPAAAMSKLPRLASVLGGWALAGRAIGGR